MLNRERGTAGRDHVSKTRSVEREHIEITFDEDDLVFFTNKFLRLKKSERDLTLMEDRRLGRVHVLRTLVASALRRRSGHRSAAKADHFAAKIEDRKHGAVAKEIEIANAPSR